VVCRAPRIATAAYPHNRVACTLTHYKSGMKDWYSERRPTIERDAITLLMALTNSRP